MAHTPDLPHFFEENINLEGLFDILSPKNNLVLADDMMLSDADGIILRVSENYERNFGFTHDSIVGKSAFDLEACFPQLHDLRRDGCGSAVRLSAGRFCCHRNGICLSWPWLPSD